MAGSAKSIAPKPRKRVEAETGDSVVSLVRAKDGSAFARCVECKKDVPVVLINMHSCSLDARIKMNLEAQVVEKPAELKKKPAERKKSTSTSSEPKPKRMKKSKDPNMPKRPQSAFFLFMDDFRKTYKEANPDAKGVTGVTKEAGVKWKSMTEEDKKPYQDRAAQLKAEYQKTLESDSAEAEDNGGSDKEDAEKEVQDLLDDEHAEKQVQDVLDDEDA